MLSRGSLFLPNIAVTPQDSIKWMDGEAGLKWAFQRQQESQPWSYEERQSTIRGYLKHIINIYETHHVLRLPNSWGTHSHPDEGDVMMHEVFLKNLATCDGRL